MSNTSFSRRHMLAASGGALIGAHPALAATSNVSGMPQEGPDTPKLTMYVSSDPTVSELKKVKQIGINIVDMPDMPPPPWTVDWFRKRQDLLAAQGLKLGQRSALIFRCLCQPLYRGEPSLAFEIWRVLDLLQIRRQVFLGRKMDESRP